MRRQSFQNGFVQSRGNRLTLRYKIRDTSRSCGWREIRETLPPGTSATKARSALRDRINQINRRNNSEWTHDVLFREFAETTWKGYLESKKAKASTLYSYGSMLNNHILPAIGDLPIKDISSRNISDLLDPLRATKKPKYLINLFALLNVMFEVAKDYGLIESVPTKKKIHRPELDRKEKSAYTPEELARIIRNIPIEFHVLFLTIAVLGIRPGEVLGFKWQDFDYEAKELTVNRNLWRRKLDTPKTKASRKTFQIPTLLADMLNGSRLVSRFNDEDDFIFTALDGRPLDQDHLRTQVLYPALRLSGLPIRPRQSGLYLFRHSAGSILYEMTRDVHQVKEFLRHTRIGTTSDIYVHASDSVIAEGPQQMMDAILNFAELDSKIPS
jgi:integrase